MSPARKTSREASEIAQSQPLPLRGPLLGLLINQEQPNHLYKIAGLLAQCLPTWKVTKGTVDYALKQLQQEDLARGSTFGSGKTIYVPTVNTQDALDEWMTQPVSSAPVREELHARIISSCPHHAEILLDALDLFEDQCYAKLHESAGAEGGMRSWRSLTISVVRRAEDEEIHAKIRWARNARKSLKDYVERDKRD